MKENIGQEPSRNCYLTFIYSLDEQATKGVSYEDADQSPAVGREASILGYMLSAGTEIGTHRYGTQNFHASKNRTSTLSFF